MRKQFVLDKRTNELLEELASCGGGNRRSLIMREAIQVYADMEDHLDKIETNPALQEMMRKSEEAIRKRQVTSHQQVIGMSRALGKRRPKKHQ